VGLQQVLSGLHLIAPFNGYDELVHREAFGAGGRDRYASTLQEYRPLRLVNQKVETPKGLGIRAGERLHRRGLGLVLVGTAIRPQEIDPVPGPVAVLGGHEWIVEGRHLPERLGDLLQHAQGWRHAFANILRDAPELRKSAACVISGRPPSRAIERSRLSKWLRQLPRRSNQGLGGPRRLTPVPSPGGP
jgi:hypothetical protein